MAKERLGLWNNQNRYSRIRKKEDYNLLLKSGMFWVFYPELTGDWWFDNETFFKDK